MLLLVRNGHVSGDTVVCVGRLRATCIELSSRTPPQYPPLVVDVPKGCFRDPVLRTQIDGISDVLSFIVRRVASLPARWTLVVPGVTIVSVKDDSIMSVHRCSIVLSDAENLVSVGSRPRSLDSFAFCPSTRSMLLPCYGLSPTQVARRGRAGRTSSRNATWLILPVVICLSQRLSHACVSMN